MIGRFDRLSLISRTFVMLTEVFILWIRTSIFILLFCLLHFVRCTSFLVILVQNLSTKTKMNRKLFKLQHIIISLKNRLRKPNFCSGQYFYFYFHTVWLQHFLRSSVTLQQPLPIIRATIEWKVDLLTIYLLMFLWNYLCK